MKLAMRKMNTAEIITIHNRRQHLLSITTSILLLARKKPPRPMITAIIYTGNVSEIQNIAEAKTISMKPEVICRNIFIFSLSIKYS